MKKQNGATGTAFGATAFLNTAVRARQAVLPIALLLSGLASAAQEPQVHILPNVPKQAQTTLAYLQDQALQDQAQQPSPATKTLLTVPAGTRLSVAPVRWISLKHTRPGDNVNLQITFPVAVGNQMVIPPGTYIQGVVDRITRRDGYLQTGYHRHAHYRYFLNVQMRSAEIIFANGYTVTIPGLVYVEPAFAQLTLPDSPNGQSVPTLAAAGENNIPVMAAAGSSTPPGLPPLPSLGNGPRNAFIAVGVAAGVATVVTVALAIHRSDTVMEVGTPMEIVLPGPLFLEEDRVLAAIQRYGAATPQIVQPPQRICWTPDGPDGTSGTSYPCPR